MKKKIAHTTRPILKEIWLPTTLLLFLSLTLSITSCSTKAENPYSPHNLMGRGFGLSSSSLLVQNLDSASTYFQEVLGFNVAKKDSFEKGFYEGSRNLMISFADMSSIELLSLEDSISKTAANTFIQDFLEKQEGVGMYSLSSSATDSTKAWLGSQGFKMDSIQSHSIPSQFGSGNSKWEDGKSQVFHLTLNDSVKAGYMPDFMEAADFPFQRMHEWNSFYHMQREFLGQPNGVLGIIALHIAVEDLGIARKEFAKMGLSELDSIPSDKEARFKVKGNQLLHLQTPLSPDDEVFQFLDQRGPGVFAITFEVKDLDATYEFLQDKLEEGGLLRDTVAGRITIPADFAFGVQLEFVEESETQAQLAEKLKMNFGGKLDSTTSAYAEEMYIKYCALCHGENREGYAADNAPSLKSKSLMATAKTSNFLRYTIQYGRANTAMAGYYSEQGGPLELIEVEILLKWLHEQSGVEEPINLSRETVAGDPELGGEIYAAKCAVCHGKDGEGISAPALGNNMLLATATDEFLKYAIKEGRDGTPMLAFKDSLKEEEINGLTAFLRSRSSGWDVPKGDSVKVPEAEEYVLNPDNKNPDFELRDGLYLSAEQLNKAMGDSARMVLLDARSTVAWKQTHIPGSIPVPYYEEPEAFVENIPNDSTWIVAYCACPHAASGRVIKKLKKYGYKNLAILDEGILVWAEMGFPVRHGN